MKKFYIEVRETLKRVVTVEAENIDEAKRKVEAKYNNEEIVLDYNDLAAVDYIEQNGKGLTFEDVLNKAKAYVNKNKTNRRCTRCGSPVIKSEIKDYYGECYGICQGSLFFFETVEASDISQEEWDEVAQNIAEQEWAHETAKETVYYDSRGESGNIFVILGKVRKVLCKQHRINDFNEMWEAVQKCDSYQNALDVISDYVHLVDESEQ